MTAAVSVLQDVSLHLHLLLLYSSFSLHQPQPLSLCCGAASSLTSACCLATRICVFSPGAKRKQLLYSRRIQPFLVFPLSLAQGELGLGRANGCDQKQCWPIPSLSPLEESEEGRGKGKRREAEWSHPSPVPYPRTGSRCVSCRMLPVWLKGLCSYHFPGKNCSFLSSQEFPKYTPEVSLDILPILHPPNSPVPPGKTQSCNSYSYR